MSQSVELSVDISRDGIKVETNPSRKRTHKGKSRLEFPERYVVIDLETTGLDARFDNIIEVAGIRYDHGQETGRFHSLVKPYNQISEYISELTGITNEMVESAPEEDEILPGFYDFIADDIVVGHNVNFDVNFLYDCADGRKETPFSNDYVDTLQLSRRLCPELPNHKLETLAAHLGVSVQGAHRALEDCLTAQGCFLKLKEEAERRGGVPKLDWERWGSMSKTIAPRASSFNEDSPIFGRSFAFTGKLERMTHKQAMQAVADTGGILCDGVIASTNYLVLGCNDYCKAIQGGKSNKQKKAEKMQLNGADIQVISEDVFYDMLQDSGPEEEGIG